RGRSVGESVIREGPRRGWRRPALGGSWADQRACGSGRRARRGGYLQYVIEVFAQAVETTSAVRQITVGPNQIEAGSVGPVSLRQRSLRILDESDGGRQGERRGLVPDDEDIDPVAVRSDRRPGDACEVGRRIPRG